MESASILQGIAEVAIGLAGFAGIAAGLGYRAAGSWSLPDRKRLTAVILFGLGTIFACFIPYALHHIGIDPPWRIASALCLYTPLRGLYSQYKIIRGNSKGYRSSALVLLAAMEALMVVLLVSVILGFAGEREFGFYLTSTLITLGISSFLFYRLLETSFSSGNKTIDSNKDS